MLEDKAVYGSRLVVIGKFRCTPEEKNFEYTGPTPIHIIAFPRIPVEIQPAGRDPVVADANVCMLHNSGQEYERRALCPDGDRCEWFSFSQSTIEEFAQDSGQRISDGLPFIRSHSSVSSSVYYLQRLVFRYADEFLKQDNQNCLWIEEASLFILEQVLGGKDGKNLETAERNRMQKAVVKRKAKVRECLNLLSRNFREPFSLNEVAAAIDVSPFHLCRVFRKATGFTIHEYLTNLRLRTSLECLQERRENLTELALDLGFSSHSHFSTSFCRKFGISPSNVRDFDIKTLKEQNRNILKARINHRL